MARIRGVEIGTILRTQADVMEFCYPEMHKRSQAQKAPPPPVPVVASPPPPPPPAGEATPPPHPKKWKKKHHSESEQPAQEAEPESDLPKDV